MCRWKRHPHLQRGAALQCLVLCLSESHRLQLSPEDIAAAEACGVTFLPATPAQVQRLSMQRKIFYAGGQPILATRGDGFFETVGTLQRVIEEGLLQQRDLAAWQQDAMAAVVPKAEPEPATQMFAPTETMPFEINAADTMAEARPVAEQLMPPKRARRSRRSVAVTSWPLEEMPEAEQMPLSTLASDKPASVIATRSGPQPGQRWRVAGATRRGRAEKHWSQKQR